MSEYISKETIKGIVQNGISTDTEADKEYVCALIDSLPSADVRENIHGHWEVGFGNTWCSCSECSGNGSTNWSYCPWCGADMREPKE